MTCYFRHLKHVFEKAEIKVAKKNKQKIDRILHGIVGVEYKNCPNAWKEIRKRLAEGEDSFVSKLKVALVEHTV
jgi:hypothetical protein